jgi:hypothetical protein
MITLSLQCGSVGLRENGIDFLLLQVAYWTLNTAPTWDLPHLSATCLRSSSRQLTQVRVDGGTHERDASTQHRPDLNRAFPHY